MKRNVDLNEISDGRLYSANDMVKVECGDCAGCSACCQNMGTSVVLDPMDIWKMQRGTGRMLEKLLKKELEADIMRKMDFIIFFKLMNVEKNHVER